MRVLAVVVACCIGCSTGLPDVPPSDAGDGLGGDGGATPDLAGDGGALHDLAGDLAVEPGAPPLHLVVSSVPASSSSGTVFSVSFQVLDEANQPVDISRPVFLALGLHPTGATLSGGTSVVATNSMATFQLSLDHWGAYTLIATTPDAPPAETPIVNVHGTKLQWVTQPSTAYAHQPMAPPVQVGIIDDTGALDTTATGQVNLAIGPTSCPGPVLGTASVTAAAGVATFDNVYLDKACLGALVQASGVAPLASQAIVSNPFDVVANVPAQLRLEAVLAHGVASRSQPFDLVAHIEDAGGNEVPLSTTVTLSVSPSATLGGPTSVMSSGTTATFTGVSIGSAGPFTFGASVPGLQTGYLSLTVSPWQWRGPNVGYLVVDPTNPAVLWITSASTGNGQLARSTDGGATFAAVGSQPNDAVWLAIDPSVPTTMYGSSTSDTWKSTNGGQTTTTLSLTGGPFAVTIDPSSSSHLYAVSRTSVWKSVDGGSSWSAITPASASNLSALAVDPTSSAIVYLSGNSIWRSTDAGATWSAAGGLPPPGSYGFSRVTVDPAQPSTLVSCDESGCYRSVDSGANFAQVYYGSLGIDPIVVAFDPTAPTAVYACGSAGLAASSDGGATFALVPLYPSNNVDSYTLAPSSPSTIYFTNSDGTWASTTGGK